MEDRFKLRFWDKIMENMIEFGDWENAMAFLYLLQSGDTIPMQCTGLKDKNGNLIYEGDIVKYTSKPSKKQDPRIKPLVENYKVVWSEKFTGYQLQASNGVNCQSIAVVLEQIEVIGNIYENPELLGVENANI
ncbi:MAG: YopX family protein [Candidatus Gastranaerophilales bacterium]|nr:YopX family protein [Candidatus Gastranaerophilales bacterium]